MRPVATDPGSALGPDRQWPLPFPALAPALLPLVSRYCSALARTCCDCDCDCDLSSGQHTTPRCTATSPLDNRHGQHPISDADIEALCTTTADRNASYRGAGHRHASPRARGGRESGWQRGRPVSAARDNALHRLRQVPGLLSRLGESQVDNPRYVFSGEDVVGRRDGCALFTGRIVLTLRPRQYAM